MFKLGAASLRYLYLDVGYLELAATVYTTIKGGLVLWCITWASHFAN